MIKFILCCLGSAELALIVHIIIELWYARPLQEEKSVPLYIKKDLTI